MPFDFTGGEDRPAGDIHSGSVKSLKLEFSKAADYNRINALFDPQIKRQIDPDNYVVKRLESAFRDAVNRGSAAMLSDDHGNVQTLTIAYHVNEDDDPRAGPHDHTELGTSLARLPGFGSAKLVVAALALREWWLHPPKGEMVAEIKNKNVPSVKTYQDGLGWELLADQGLSARIYEAADKTLADEKDMGTGTKTGLPPDEAPSHWYRCGDRALAVQARILLEYMNQGGLLNKHTGEKIDVDFSGLDSAGLTRTRLRAMAAGETSRARLLQLGGP